MNKGIEMVRNCDRWTVGGRDPRRDDPALVGRSRINKRYDIQPEALTIPTDDQASARGRHLDAALLTCTDCHGEDLSGKVLIDEPGLFAIYAPNLTAGEGGAGAYFTDADWVRAIRHGVDPDGKALLFMPAEVFSNLSAEDLVDVIAYIKSFPPVDNHVPEPEVSPIGLIISTLGVLSDVTPARIIDHQAPFPAAPAPSKSAQYGAYLVSIGFCTQCHREDLSGGPFPFAAPNAPPVPNITSAGSLGTWSVELFRDTLRTGVTPYGKVLNPEFMPWEFFRNMTDEEMAAVWHYLQSLGGAAQNENQPAYEQEN
jgi:cytochrome c553